jgi:hypothetical protein
MIANESIGRPTQQLAIHPSFSVASCSLACFAVHRIASCPLAESEKVRRKEKGPLRIQPSKLRYSRCFSDETFSFTDRIVYLARLWSNPKTTWNKTQLWWSFAVKRRIWRLERDYDLGALQTDGPDLDEYRNSKERSNQKLGWAATTMKSSYSYSLRSFLINSNLV